MNFAIVAFFALCTWWHYQRINATITAWAHSNGYKFLEAHRWYLTFPSIGMLWVLPRFHGQLG